MRARVSDEKRKYVCLKGKPEQREAKGRPCWECGGRRGCPPRKKRVSANASALGRQQCKLLQLAFSVATAAARIATGARGQSVQFAEQLRARSFPQAWCEHKASPRCSPGRR
ncbi:hypothetical protein MTO96_026864 [Rhipicephalus appendiculatus]